MCRLVGQDSAHSKPQPTRSSTHCPQEQEQSAQHTWCKHQPVWTKGPILSIDGVGAYDTISRETLMRGVADMVDGTS